MSDMLLMQLGTIHGIFQANTAAMTHDESLRQPQPAGNNANWIAGHLVSAYNNVLPALGQEAIWDSDRAATYQRGAEPLTDPGQAVDFGQICSDFGTAHERMMAGIAALPAERWSEKAPFSPRQDPDETLGSLLGLISFHQAYHVGQLGLVRRVAGKEGAVA